jgi:hypothetical protein
VINLTAGGPYALTGSNVKISVSGEAEPVVAAKHEIKRTPIPPICLVVLTNGICGAVNPFTAKCDTNDVSPDSYTYDWTLSPGNFGKSGSGQSFSATNLVSMPGPYTLTANFTGTRKDCAACPPCYASGTANCTVYQLIATATPPWLGLDRTGVELNKKTGEGKVSLTPLDPATYEWELKSVGNAPVVCVLASYSGNTVNYSTLDKEQCSTNFLDQILEVKADITSPKPFSLSTTTNFTVVKVDVTIGSVGEEKEETEGAFLFYHPNDPLNIVTGVGTIELLPVSIKCWPTDLPSTEMVKIKAPEGFLYEKIGAEYTLAKTYYPAKEVGQKQFVLHGHVASVYLMDRSITVTHEKSRAEDRANFTVKKVKIVVDLDDPIIPNTKNSGLDLETLKFVLNGNQIDNKKLNVFRIKTDSFEHFEIIDTVVVQYVPAASELVFNGENTVSVDIKDKAGNVMKQEVKPFKVNIGNGY